MQSVFAQTAQPPQSAISITPPFQEVLLTASESAVSASILITNQTDQLQNFEIYPVGISQVDSQGNVTLSDKPQSGSDTSLAADISVLEPTVTIPAGGQKEVVFTINNSLNLSPGGHYVSLITRMLPPQREEISGQSVLPALSSFLLLRKVGGEQYNLFLKTVTFPTRLLWFKLPTVANLTFENQGNVHTIPRGQVTVVDLFGRNVAEGTINEGSHFVLPRAQRELPVQIRRIRSSWPLMVYRVTVTGESDPGGVTFGQTSFSFYISQSAGIALIFAAVVGSVIAVWLRRRRQKLKNNHDAH